MKMQGNRGKRIDVTWKLLAGGVAYIVWLRVTGLGIPCIFRKITGWLCPGCGITTLFLCLTRLDIGGAFAANPFLFVTLPFLAAEVLYDRRLRRRNERQPKWNEAALVVYGVSLLAFGVLRNIS